MKLKNLFLASIAVAALTACSNETEFIDNGNQTIVKDASMQFGIALPQGSLTRAGEGVTGDNEIGIDSENTFVDITLVMQYASSRDIYTFKRNEFTQDTGNQMLFLKESISVQAGNATVSAFVNASEALKAELKTSSLDALVARNNYSSSIDDLTSSIAKPGNFLMSGSKANQDIKEGEVNKITVPVDRVAAKLVEKSRTDAFTITTATVAPESNKQLTITLESYNFANLLQDTYVLDNNSPITSDLYNAYAKDSYTKWEVYGKSKTITGATDANDASNITYCTENKTANATMVLYKAVATWGGQAASTFYVNAENKVFLSFDELKQSAIFDGLTDKSSIEEFAKRGIKKYQDGVCYYKSSIKSINRNNVYYLNVKSIADLGDPTPGETVTPSTINLGVEIKPWIIHNVDIEL